MDWSLLHESLRLGVKISLAAIPYSLVYIHLRMFNFAFGEVITFAGYVLFVLIQHAHWPLWAALCAAVVLSAVLGVAIERVAYRPLMESKERHLLLVSSIGVSIALQNLYQAICGSRTMYLDHSDVHGTSMAVVLIIEVIVLTVALRHTRYGDQVAAVASERNLAQLLGVNPGLLYSLVFAIASALAVPAGLFELSDSGIAPDMGFHLGLVAFAATVVAGLNSIWWTVAASLVLAFLLQLAQMSSVLNERLVWALCVIGAILIAAARRAFRHYRRARRGEDTGQ